MAGYQGWFLAEGDGYDSGFVHCGGIDRTPPRATVDLWPDLSEFDVNETFPTNFSYADGTPARVFSSAVPRTVDHHFEWMADYGIDGVFVQRFGAYIRDQSNWNYQRACAVLNLSREGANRHGRLYAVMYDVAFDRSSVEAIKADWTRLVNEMKLMETPAYLRLCGAPVVSLWGYGFGHRAFDPEAAEELLQFFKKPENGGCTIMLGVPNDWASWTDERMTLLRSTRRSSAPGTWGAIALLKRRRAIFVSTGLAIWSCVGSRISTTTPWRFPVFPGRIYRMGMLRWTRFPGWAGASSGARWRR